MRDAINKLKNFPFLIHIQQKRADIHTEDQDFLPQDEQDYDNIFKKELYKRHL